MRDRPILEYYNLLRLWKEKRKKIISDYDLISWEKNPKSYKSFTSLNSHESRLSHIHSLIITFDNLLISLFNSEGFKNNRVVVDEHSKQLTHIEPVQIIIPQSSVYYKQLFAVALVICSQKDLQNLLNEQRDKFDSKLFLYTEKDFVEYLQFHILPIVDQYQKIIGYDSSIEKINEWIRTQYRKQLSFTFWKTYCSEQDFKREFAKYLLPEDEKLIPDLISGQLSHPLKVKMSLPQLGNLFRRIRAEKVIYVKNFTLLANYLHKTFLVQSSENFEYEKPNERTLLDYLKGKPGGGKRILRNLFPEENTKDANKDE